MDWTKKTLVIATFLAVGSAGAAQTAAGDAAKTQYDAEKARCMSGTTGQDQASCLKSAGAAYDSARQNRLNDAGNYKANALDRCKNLPAADKTDCEARVGGAGTTSGSVKDGGILRETVTPVPAVTK